MAKLKNINPQAKTELLYNCFVQTFLSILDFFNNFHLEDVPIVAQ